MGGMLGLALVWLIQEGFVSSVVPCLEQRTTKEEFTLQTLTFIGCGVSFCALIVTFILFLVVR